MRSTTLGQGLWRQAWIGLWRHRPLHAATVATLALLGAVLLALAALAHDLLLAPWTYDSQRFGVLRHGLPGATSHGYGFAPDEYRVLRGSGLFEQLSASQSGAVAYGDGRGAARSLLRVRTEPSALAVTDARPLLGRFIEAGDSGDDSMLVLSYALWQSEFGADPAVLGRSLLLDGRPRSIVGVMPPRFHFQGGDLWQPHLVDPLADAAVQPRLVLNYKLPPGVDHAMLAGPLAALVDRFPRRADATRYPRGWAPQAARVLDAVVGPLRPAVLLVLAGAAVLFLLGVANVAALLLARQLADAGQMATRLALGEGRARSIAVAALEALALASVALLLALPLAALLLQACAGLLSNEWVPRELEGQFGMAGVLDWRLLPALLAVALALLAVRLPGLLRADARACLHGALRAGGGARERRLLAGLAALQVALACAVGLATLAIGRGAADLAERDLGFRPDGALHAQLVFPADRYPDGAARLRALERIESELRRQGQVEAIGFTDSAPLQRYSRGAALQQWSGPPLADPLAVDYRAVHGALPAALGLRLSEGRWLDPTLDAASAAPAAVVSRALAEQLAPGGSALGASLTVAVAGQPALRRIVVGVVDDVLHESALAQPRPLLYVPYAQEPGPAVAGGRIALIVRFRAGQALEPAALARALAAVDPWIALHEVVPLTARGERALAGMTLARQLFAGFAVLGLALATLGIAAVAGLGVRGRQHELGVRGALGAGPRGLLLLVLDGSLRGTALACLAGVLLALPLLQVLGPALQGIARLQLLHLLAVPLGLLALAAAAAALPARRAMRVDPLGLLRSRG